MRPRLNGVAFAITTLEKNLEQGYFRCCEGFKGAMSDREVVEQELRTCSVIPVR